MRSLILGATLSLLAGAALADPCRAIPDRGPMPKFLSPGNIFAGPVVYVADGDGLCVALGSDPMQWVEIRLADFFAPELNSPGGREAKSQLERLVLRRRVECVAGRRSYDRVVARCTLLGHSVGDLMRSAGIKEGGNGR